MSYNNKNSILIGFNIQEYISVKKNANDYLVILEHKNHVKSIKAGNDFFWEIMH